MPEPDADLDTRRGEWMFAAAIAVVYLAVASFAISRHEMWRDELHCWLVARDAATPWDVVRARAYDGQPPLFYLVLWVLTRFTWRPEAMRVLHVAIATTNVVLFARFAPFGRVARGLFAFGYFALYEYAAISRCYGLALLFVLLIAAGHARRHERPIMTGVLLAALALTATVATVVSGAYCAALTVELLAARRRGTPMTGRAWAPIALGIVGCLTAAISAWPPPDSTVARFRDMPGLTEDFAPTRIIPGILPIPNADFFFWNSNALMSCEPLRRVALVPAIAIAAWIVFVLSRVRAAAVLFAVGSALLVVLFGFVYSGDTRHHGFFFVLFLMGAWLATAASSPARAGWRRVRDAALAPTLVAVLVAHLPGAVIAIAYDTRYVFSSGARAAEVLRVRGLANVPIVAEVDYPATAMLGQLGPHSVAFSPRTGRNFTFVRWTRDRHWYPTDEQTLRFAASLGAQHGEDAVLVMNRPLLPELVDGARVVRLAELYDSMIEEENFYIYRVRRAD
jgi:hypothetical protein